MIESQMMGLPEGTSWDFHQDPTWSDSLHVTFTKAPSPWNADSPALS